MPTARIAAGQSTPGQGWVAYGANGIYIDVDTTAARFTGSPVYVTSIGSTGGSQWNLVGPSAVYSATATRFRVYVQWKDGSALTPATAQSYGWFINWVGYDNP
ncbi:hypothetical protein [Spongiactinospora sp. TRM90649]|uniref:hypothetical protein n=1 Tax=Spongiactinospora sp. TRM90649 TaxID=3031114 RepID=UPI0023F67984|nr:hypothetical protein [Spongiactinospora sp. TRM90649]MDF5754282.1 hypothetical protein [Spongiactinospora sp. TRM90649]